jgi:hypothetical protein
MRKEAGMDARSHGARWQNAGIFALALLLSAAPLAVAAPGDLDPSFGGDGKVTTDFGTGSPEDDGFD